MAKPFYEKSNIVNFESNRANKPDPFKVLGKNISEDLVIEATGPMIDQEKLKSQFFGATKVKLQVTLFISNLTLIRT